MLRIKGHTSRRCAKGCAIWDTSRVKTMPSNFVALAERRSRCQAWLPSSSNSRWMSWSCHFRQRSAPLSRHQNDPDCHGDSGGPGRDRVGRQLGAPRWKYYRAHNSTERAEWKASGVACRGGAAASARRNLARRGRAFALAGFKEYEVAARALKIQLQSLEVRGPNPDLEGAFQAARKGNARAVITITNSPFFHNAKRIADLAIKHRLPSMFEGSSWVETGGLMSYSANDLAAFRRAATFVDKILKGTKPADLPVEQPTKFDFVINLKTAKQIGLTIPQWTLMKADKVIK